MTTQEQADWWDGGYQKGYSAGYSRAIEEVQSWLRDEGHAEAASALEYLFSPEGIAEQNRKINELYGSLRALSARHREETIEGALEKNQPELTQRPRSGSGQAFPNQ